MIIDIFIAVADKGGVENVINATASYLKRQGNTVRLIQAVWEHHPWTCPEIDFYYLSDQRANQDSEKWKNGYLNFLEENGYPDVILATNWPLMSLITRQVLAETGKRIPVVSWVHNPIERYAAAGYGGVEMLQYADAHLVINQRIESEIRNAIANARTARVNNPVSGDRVCYSENRMQKELLFVGRISDQKNLPILLYGIKKAKTDYYLTLIGEGPEETKLKRIVRENGLKEKVHFVGWSDDPWKATGQKGFLVMSSLYEGFPVTAIEALLSGMPVISTPVDGIVEIIKPGVNGFLYPQGDSDGLAEVLDYIVGGVLPVPTAEACRSSANPFLEENALPDFYEKLKGLI